MELKVLKVEDKYTVNIDGVTIRNVNAYKIMTSESGEAEVELRIKLSTTVSTIEMSTN